MRMCIAAIVAAIWLVASPAAEAVPINYATTGSGTLTFFPGDPQESQFDFGGCPGSHFSCETSLDLTPGVPLTAISQRVDFDIGTNVGTFPTPDDTQDIQTVYTVGSQSVTLSQDVRFRQIGNGQFMLNISASPTATLDLGALGLLDITASSFASQLPSSFGGGGVLRSTFLLRAPATAVPEPATAALLGAGLAGLGTLWHRRRRRR